MKKSKILLSILCISTGLSVFTGCSSNTSLNQSNEEKLAPQDIYIPVVAKGLEHKFWQAVKKGAEQAGSDLGIKVTYDAPETEDQVDKQLEMLASVLDKNPQAIAFAALDSKASDDYLEKANTAGIPVIGFDSGVDNDIVTTTCATDNYLASAEAAHHLAKLIGEKGKVGLIVQDIISTSGTNRRDGFIDTIQKDYPNITIIGPLYSQGDIQKSKELAKTIMEAYPDLNGFYGTNEGCASGIILATKELNKTKDITIVGFDSGKIMIDAILEGVAAGAISQDPISIGYKAVETSYKAYMDEEELPELIDTGFKWFDKTNINTPEIQAIIYE